MALSDLLNPVSKSSFSIHFIPRGLASFNQDPIMIPSNFWTTQKNYMITTNLKNTWSPLEKKPGNTSGIPGAL